MSNHIVVPPSSLNALMALTMAAAATFMAAIPASPAAQAGQDAIISGRCEYSPEVARYHQETALILCDSVTISHSSASTTLDFSQRSWGSMAQFSGMMSGVKMTVSHIALRGSEPRSATGTCETFHREDGRLAAIRCFGKAGHRSFAVNFIPSFL